MDRAVEVNRPYLFLASLCLYLDDVGIRTGAVPVVGAYPVVIRRICAKARNASVVYIANVQILIPRDVSPKLTGCGHIQAVPSRTAYTVPVRSETANSQVGCVGCYWSSGRGCWCRSRCWCRRRGWCRCRGRSRIDYNRVSLRSPAAISIRCLDVKGEGPFCARCP